MTDLRPTTFTGIIGQSDVKECLKIAIYSARRRNDVLQHSLFLGPPGTGKTTLALVTAKEMDSKIYLANGGNIKNIKDVLPYLVRLQRGDILFIDEIHRVHTRVQEALFTVMEDFRLDVAKGATSINLEPFTLIGATTEAGMLLRPFYDRFTHQFMLEDYSVDELSKIIEINTSKLDIHAEPNAIVDIAQRSRYTPRIANHLLEWCRDYSVSLKERIITPSIVEKAMNLKKIDQFGLDTSDRKYIMALRNANKPLGLNTLVAMTGLSRETVENQVEPYLLKLGTIEKTSKGRRLL